MAVIGPGLLPTNQAAHFCSLKFFFSPPPNLRIWILRRLQQVSLGTRRVPPRRQNRSRIQVRQTEIRTQLQGCLELPKRIVGTVEPR